jgi:deazaflavin-dependent oxidoreductase (nitroreductase family)
MSESPAGANEWNQRVIEEFRAGQERVGGQFDRTVLLLLTTTGARSGQPRISPLAHFVDGDRLVIVASAAGRDANPAWYHNILAHPRVTVERWDGDTFETFEALARVVEPDEHDRLYAWVVEQAPGFAEYQKQTSRVIPVVTLTRLE